MVAELAEPEQVLQEGKVREQGRRVQEGQLPEGFQEEVLPAEGEGKAEGELLPQGEGKYQEKDYYIQKAKNHQKGRYFVNEYYKENIEKEKKDQRKN